MKKLLCIISILSLTKMPAYAQASFNTIESIDVNNITANMLVHGDMMWNPIDYSMSGCQYPAHSGKTANFATSLWVSGYDAANNLHIAAQTYRQSGNDFWPGPLTGDTLTYPNSYSWAKIWKVNQTDIQYFQSLSTHTIANTPQPILTWPGKGSAYAQGNAGASLTVDQDMAPFIDLNANGVYEPLLGDYPNIKGDQALWWVFSDNGPAHTETKGLPLGIEVHAMAYGYRRNTLIDNVIYLDYTVENKSAYNYNNVRVGWFDDVEIGWYLDDYVGFDSSKRMGITYKATIDDGGSASHPVNDYGSTPPQTGLTLIVLPGDAGASYVPAGSFICFNNDASLTGNPTVDTEYNNYMRAKLRNGQHFIHDTSSSGIASGPDCNYLFTGDPADSNQWSECSTNSPAGDRRVVLSSNDFSLTVGGSQHIVIAFLTTDTIPGGCGHTNFNDIKIVADTAWGNYFNPPAPNAVANVRSSYINLYPSPAHDKLYLEAPNAAAGQETITVYNILGQITEIPISKNSKKYEMDIRTLPNGVYELRYSNAETQTTAKFVKD